MQGVRLSITLLDAVGAVEVELVTELEPILTDENAEDVAPKWRLVELCADARMIELITTMSAVRGYIVGNSAWIENDGRLKEKMIEAEKDKK